MSNYYAVRHGRTPGIYYSWDACNQQIHKFSGAIFKGFKNLNEAQNFISVGHTDNNSNDNNGIVNQIIPGRETMSSLLSTAHNGGAFSTTFSATRGVPSLFASTSTEQAFASATQPQIALPSSSTQIFHPSGTNTNTMNSNVGLFGSRNANSLSATSSRNMHTARSAESSGPVDQIQSVQTIDEYDNANLKVPMARDTIVIYVDGGCDGTYFSK